MNDFKTQGFNPQPDPPTTNFDLTARTQPVSYLSYKLENVLISSYQTSGSAG